MSSTPSAEAQRAALVHAARAHATDAVCRAGATDPFSPACDAAVLVLRYELQRIERMSCEQLAHSGPLKTV